MKRGSGKTTTGGKKSKKQKRLLTVIKGQLSSEKNSEQQIVKELNCDYFVRFKYNLEEVITILQSASGQPLQEFREAYDILLDFGFLEYLNENYNSEAEEVDLDLNLNAKMVERFQFTEDLQARIEAQFTYLSQIYNHYENGENVYLFNPKELVYEMAQIIEQVSVFDTDFYTLKLLNKKSKSRGGSSTSVTLSKEELNKNSIFLCTHNELNQWNSPSCTLPADEWFEKIDWDNDYFWQKKLNNFKLLLKQKNLTIDFRQSSEQIFKTQAAIVKELLSFFSLNKELVPQKERGIGVRACGGGSVFEESAIYTLAIQAIGHTLGIKAILIPGEHFRIEVKSLESKKNQELHFLSFKNAEEFGPELNQPSLEKSPPLAHHSSIGTPGINKISHLQEVSECVIATGPLFTEKLQGILHLDESMRASMVEVYKEQKSQNKVFALEEAILSQQNSLILNVKNISGAQF